MLTIYRDRSPVKSVAVASRCRPCCNPSVSQLPPDQPDEPAAPQSSAPEGGPAGRPPYEGPPPAQQSVPPPPPPPGQYAAPPPAALRPDEEKLWAIGAHLGPLLLGFIAPLVVWLVFRERSAFLDRQGKEALNFQLTLLIAYIVSFVLVIVLIGLLLLFAVWVVSIVFMIMAAVKVSSMQDYRYPVTIRFIK